MPVPKNKLSCKNGCGLLIKGVTNPKVYGHALVEVVEKEDRSVHFNLNRAFVVEVYKCTVCGYIELYDAPPVPGQE